jgi:hypothetical protein
MEHIAALLLIVGCSNSLADCRELPSPTTVFESFEECTDELPVRLHHFAGQQPRVIARCVYVDPAMEEEDAELSWNVEKDGTLAASVGVPAVVVASGKPEAAQDAVQQ